MWAGLREIAASKPLSGIGQAVGAFARKSGYTLVRNLARHGVGLSLHEAPTEIATWPNAAERRIMGEELALTVEPFLSFGAEFARDCDDPWTLYSQPCALTVQYEHTVVATRSGPLVLALPGQQGSGRRIPPLFWVHANYAVYFERDVSQSSND